MKKYTYFNGNFVLTHTTDKWNFTTYKLSMENTIEYTLNIS